MIRLDTIKAVYDRDVRPFVRETPVYRGRGIATFAECNDLYFKMENLQRTGSFKIRGGCARVAMLTDAERKRGVVTASAGNHAQGLALASSEARVPCRVVMPRMASNAKVEATRSYGADVILDGENFDEAVAIAKGIAEAEGRVFVSAYDDDGIITGQGSIGVELLEQLPDVDTVIIPIGGGGLFAGVSCALKEAKPGLRVIGVQAEGADAAARSFKAGHLVPRKLAVDTIADGIAIKAPSERTFRYIQRYADDVVTVSDDAIAQAILLLLTRMKVLVEPSGAASLAALLEHKGLGQGRTICLLCGGNMDLKLLADIIERGMIRQGRYLHIFTAVKDKPGGLAGLLDAVASVGGNIMNVEHNRLASDVRYGATGVELLVETRGAEHASTITRYLIEQGYPVRPIDHVGIQ